MAQPLQDHQRKRVAWFSCIILACFLGLISVVLLLAPFNELTNTDRVIDTDGTVLCHFDRDFEFIFPFWAALVWLLTIPIAGRFLWRGIASKKWLYFSPIGCLSLFSAGLAIALLIKMAQLVRYNHEFTALCL